MILKFFQATCWFLLAGLWISPSSGQLLMGPRCSPEVSDNSSLHSLALVSKSVEAFSLDLFDRTVLSAGDKMNILISPLSVWATLAMVAEGGAGDTYVELARALRLPASLVTTRSGYSQISRVMLVNTSTVELETVSAIFTDVNLTVEPAFECLVESVYHAELNSVNFRDVKQATKFINNFVKEKTRNKIEGIVTEGDMENAQLILTNAVFFRGQWTTPFNKTNTKQEPFYDEAGNVVGVVNMMFDLGNYPYTMVPDLGAHILEIPYGKEDRLSMYVLLPLKGVRLQEVLGKVKRMRLQELTDMMNRAAEEYGDDMVELRLPRFKVSTDLVLNVVLEEMGIVSMFDPHYADLSKISGRKVCVSQILHKADIEVTEEGTEAAAVTAGTIINKIAPPSFYCNRPFAYFIVEKSTKIIVFAGKYSSPPSEKF